MKTLSIGINYDGGRQQFLEKLLPVISHIEVNPDALVVSNKGIISLHQENLRELLSVKSDVDIIAHGQGLSIGSADGFSKTYLRLLDELFDCLPLKWHSEHLAYSIVEGVQLGAMLTLPRTDDTLDMICERVDIIQKRYAAPFLLENVASLIPEYYSDYSHADFFNRICDKTGCGLILDIYNLECDAYNHDLNIPVFLEELNCNHIREFHVAGGMLDSGFMTDIHIGLTAESTLELAHYVINEFTPQNLEAITFEILDEFVDRVGEDEIVDELEKLKTTFHEKLPAPERTPA